MSSAQPLSMKLIDVDASGASSTLSEEAFAARVANAAAYLDARGMEPGAFVAFVTRLDASTIALLAACFARGNPVVTLHPRLSSAEHAARIAAVGEVVRLPEPMPDFTEAMRPVTRLAPLSLEEERPLVVVPTSGTTGEPKGVVLSTRAFLASMRASEARAPFHSDEVALLSLPLAHVGGLSLLIRALCANATLVLPPPGPYEPARIADLVDRHGVTQLSLVPTMLARHLDEGALPKGGTLRRVLVGGAAASPTLLRRALGAGLPVRATYGLTEACSQVATQAAPDEAGVGRALEGVELRIDEAGCIALRGPTLFSGYYVAGELVRALDDEGFFRTGDLGRVDEAGCLHVLGRRSELIVTGGENVMPAEVEHALLTLSGVREVAVFGVPDEIWGERVAAVVVCDDPSLDLEAMRRALAPTLARFKLPTLVRFERSLPRLPSGKVDGRALRAYR